MSNYSLEDCGTLGIPGLGNVQSGCRPLISFLNSATIEYSGDGAVCNPLGLEVKVSPDEDNLILIKENGLYASGQAVIPLVIDETPISGGASGGILFQNADGKVSQDASNLFWDDAGNRLGIGTNEPTQKLDVNGSIFIRGRNSLYVGSTNNRITSDGGSFSVTGGTDASLSAAGSLLTINSSRAILNVPTYIGAYNNTPTAFLHVAASTTDRASLRLSTGVAPTSPNAGDVWNDGTSLNINIPNLTVLGATGNIYLPGTASTTNYIGGSGNVITISAGAQISFNTNNTGRISISNSYLRSAIPFYIGSGSTPPTAQLHLIGSTTSRASLRIDSGVAPTSPNNGDVWNNGTDIILNGTGLKIGNLQTNSNYNRIYETDSGATFTIGGGVSGTYFNIGSTRIARITNGGFATNGIKIGYSLSGGTISLLDINASTTSRAQLNLAAGVAPDSPISGDLWNEGTNLLFYNGTVNSLLNAWEVATGGINYSGGKVGINQASPTYSLDVNASAVRFGTGNAAEQSLYFNTNNNNPRIRAVGNQVFMAASGFSGLEVGAASARLAVNRFSVTVPTSVGFSLSYSPVSFLDIAASTTGRAQINLAAGVAPTSPNDGDIWKVGDDFFVRVGSTTKKIMLEDI